LKVQDVAGRGCFTCGKDPGDFFFVLQVNQGRVLHPQEPADTVRQQLLGQQILCRECHHQARVVPAEIIEGVARRSREL
jgi:hypothetical protein